MCLHVHSVEEEMVIERDPAAAPRDPEDDNEYDDGLSFLDATL